MIFLEKYLHEPLRAAITEAQRMDEDQCVNHLLKAASLATEQLNAIQRQAKDLVENVRQEQFRRQGLDSFLYEYDLSSEEGIALMCLAEALLRVPDKETVHRLIRDKIKSVDWETHVTKSDNFAVNAVTWGLMLTGKILNDEGLAQTNSLKKVLKRLLSRSSEPFIRGAIGQAMKILGRQFVMGRTIEEALQRAKPNETRGYRYSYDMLGEAARTAEDAARYFHEYEQAIQAIGQIASDKDTFSRPGISIKLSALHPRYEFAKRQRVLDELVPKLFMLAKAAKLANIGLTVDAEEADRLDLSLDIIERVFSDPSLAGWEGFGLALQSYQKRAFYVIDWLADLAKRNRRRLCVRLIKGAYWDTEIKLTQMLGLEGYPVFTRKASTDVSFIACAKKLISHQDFIYPQFATHNAYSVATILTLMGDNREFEFQCLHGMGQVLYEQIVPKNKMGIPARIYAPVGSHEDLLPYLVRRLLENGANTSFVNRLADANAPLEDLIEDPVEKIKQLADKAHPHIPLPVNLFQPHRKNSLGIDLANSKQLAQLDEALTEAQQKHWRVAPIINNEEHFTEGKSVLAPSDNRIVVGMVKEANTADVELALLAASQAAESWRATAPNARADILEKAADLLEKHRVDFMYLAIREAGKTIEDAIAEVREAVDFCRYYASQARTLLAQPISFTGYTGELNQLSLHGRGVVVCISPWNFPLAIFLGQVTAALAAGNTVVAKPAEQTALIAGLAVRLLHAAGIPGDVLHLLPGTGETIGAALVGDWRVKGVIFTGSTHTARMINQTLARREGPIIPLIAETGGQNAILVDSSALPEQVVKDTITSAFGSAGQRCSAARVLFLQEDIASKVIHMLKGAMAELEIGEPSLLSTDIGPVIDTDAKNILERHIQRMKQQGTLIYQVPLPPEAKHGTFVSPVAFEIDSLKRLEQEVFGPVLHVIRYAPKNLDQVIDDINETGFGLTLGIHSRIDETVHYIQQRVNAGNCYVNRNIIGAVVGVQPFGGEGMSGTGPKAGGPYYLPRLCVERHLCINTTAAGGNASLMMLEEN